MIEKIDSAIKRLVRFEWVDLPLRSRHLTPGLPVILTDGLFLTAWPWVAAVLPLLAFFSGLGFGWGQWGYEQAWTESMILMMVAAVFGILSARLGIGFLFGFILGDFFLARPEWIVIDPWTGETSVWEPLLQIRLPLLLSYGLLAFLTVHVAVWTKSLLSQLTPPPTLSREISRWWAFIGHGALTWTLVYFWSQAVPILIRPIFTWSGDDPPASAMEPLQEHGGWLLLIAVTVSILRIYLQGLTASQQEKSIRMDEMEHLLAAAPPVVPWTLRLPRVVRTLASTAWITLLLAGLYYSYWDAVGLGLFILLLQAARHGLIRIPLGDWPRWMERIPLLFRLVIGFVLIQGFSQQVLQEAWYWTDNFRPVLLLTALSFLILYLLNPGLPETKQPEGGKAS
ncbi:hypothetical protein [Desmospora profundinema]|uniref:Uncharacterized protein n=1 Tax=Desmospora profundinema TaxID=1571184 RepID=A0ABU1IPV7_9BACL|nr:hypothetical protein [Desmospora profundinema]MDR6226827.1 hypothetical protein [Desmospora profundinema]